MTEGRKLRVMLVEDDQLMRTGARTLIDIEPDLEVVAEVDDGARALDAFAQAKPDVVVLDLRLPGMDGVEIAKRLHEAYPDARTLILSYYQGDHDVFQALKAGALGYLPKGVDGAEFLTAVRTVAAGHKYFHPEIAGRLADGISDVGLSRREQQVLDGLVDGLTNPQIAERLNLSRRTVTMFASRLFDKLGARTRTEAVSIAIRKGFVKARE